MNPEHHDSEEDSADNQTDIEEARRTERDFNKDRGNDEPGVANDSRKFVRVKK